MSSNNTILLIGGAGAVGMLYLSYRKNRALDNPDTLANVLQWSAFALKSSKDTGIPANIILGVVWQESAGDFNAKGANGEKGLMQIKDIAAREVGYKQASFQPSINIEQGSKFLAKINGLTGNMFDSLRAYNRRGTNIKSMTPSEGSEYARSVLRKANKIESELSKLSFSDELAISTVGGLSSIAETIIKRTGGFFEGLFN